MSVKTLDLWPPINVDMVKPVAILKTQAGLVARKTKGLLEAEVKTVANKEKVQHTLDLIAPALKRRRVSVLSATHGRQNVYPVRITAACFDTRDLVAKDSFEDTLDHALKTGLQPDERNANNQDELIDLVKQVLQSGDVRSTISSLIIESNPDEEMTDQTDDEVG